MLAVPARGSRNPGNFSQLPLLKAQAEALTLLATGGYQG